MSVTIGNFTAGPQTVCGLGTYVYTTGTTATHVAKCMITEVPASGITLVIKQNSTTRLTVSSPASGQGVILGSVNLAITSGDTVSFVLTSSSATDNQLNTVKATLDVHIGANN
jgi:ribosomal protein S5